MHSPLTEGRLTANCQTGLEMFALVVNMEHEIRPKITQSDSASFDDMHACLCNRKGSAVSSQPMPTFCYRCVAFSASMTTNEFFARHLSMFQGISPSTSFANWQYSDYHIT